MKYKVKLMKDDKWEVVEIHNWGRVNEYQTSVYQGTLADCEAYIRLCESGYM